MFPFVTAFAPGEPVYEQVVFSAKRAMASGLLRPGDPFPSVRQMSQILKINPNTAQKVTARLVEEGLLEIRPGLETVVRKAPALEESAKRIWLEDSLGHLAVEALTRGISPEEVHRQLTAAFAQIQSTHTP
jgi:GntR family transcriptional regulator